MALDRLRRSWGPVRFAWWNAWLQLARLAHFFRLSWLRDFLANVASWARP